MARGGARLKVAAFVAVTLALLGGAGAFVWRSLSEQAEAAIGENSSGYVAPANIPSSLPPASLAGVRMAMVLEPDNAAWGEPGFYAAETGRWRAWLTELGATWTDPAGADVLVVPQQVCLGPESRALVARHLAAGKGIVVNGLMGARNGRCHPLPDTLLASLLGGRGSVTAFSPWRENSYYATVLGETALGAGVPPGARIEMRPANQLVFRDPDRSVYYSDFRRDPVAAHRQRFFDGAVARARVGPGRVVAFGFELSHLIPGWSEAVARSLVANAATWAAGRPVAQVAPWPGGRRAAAVIAQDVEADFQNAGRAADLLRKEHVPATFFVVGRLAERSPWTTRELVRYGEVGSHSYDHRSVEGLDEARSERVLGQARSATQALSDRPVAGFRPPEEKFTLATLQAWARLGGTYVFAANNSRAAAPEIVPLGRDTLVLLARVSDDDFEVLERSRLRDRGEMSRHMLRQVDEVMAYRGVYMFSYHSHMFSRQDLLPVLGALVHTLRSTPAVWVARAGDVASWWRARAAVRVTAAADGRSVQATNTGRAPFRDGVLLVDLPTGEQKRIALPVLQPGQSVTAALASR
jgi:peptidoglycan/xylan/chitin deacetylase (PgdA/CDA1 family)